MSENTERVWEPEEVNQNLRQLPAQIAYATKAVLDADAAVRERKHVIAMAEAAVKVKMLGEKVTATDVKAIALSQNPDLYHEMVGLETELSLKNAKIEYLRDMWDGCRKAATLRIEEMRRMEGTVSNRQR